MARGRYPILVILAALLAVSGAGAAVLHVSEGGVSKPADPDYQYLRQTFDCSNPQAVVDLAPGTVDTLRGDTTGGANQNPSYPCAIWNEPGPEHIYQLEVTDTVELTAVLLDVTALIDHDLFLLNACDTDSCQIGVNTEFTATLTAGTYFLVIDSTNRGDVTEGPYTVALEMRYPGVPPAICEPGGAEPVTCAVEVQEFASNTRDRPDLMRTYDCAPTPLRGGEVWYAVTVPAEHDLRTDFTLVAPLLDLGLWLFDGCGAEATCLAYINTTTAGLPEKLFWRNESGVDALVYLGVDSFSAPPDSAGGAFTLQVICDSNVPVESRSLGSFKSMFR